LQVLNKAMRIIKEILARIFATWAIVWFIATMLLFIFPIWLTGLWAEPKRTAILLDVCRTWMKIYFFLIGLRLRIKGKEHFKKGESYIVVCNHNSLMDVPVSTPGIPGPNKTIAKFEMSRIPVFGMIYKRGSVLVDRKSEESRRLSYVKMKEVLDMGMHMCIYPEGTRNKSGEPLQRFHDGAFRLATESGHAILPAVIFNTAKILPPKKSFYYWPAKAEMHFLPPVEPGNFSTAELKDQVFNLMKEYYLRFKS
jgi:1-acyl-sn-glycerol-3-phosphate acyltransferase